MGKDSKTQNEILEDLLCKPSTLSGLINILEKKELVKRTVDIYDARIRRIGLTEKGKIFRTRFHWYYRQVGI